MLNRIFFLSQEEYEDEPEDDAKKSVNSNFEHALEEEDPEVIKELITLIKRVGGLDELEKQLQMRLNLNEKSTIVGTSSKTTTTTISPISQSLYNKVIDTKRGNLRTQKLFGSSTQKSTETEIEPLVQRQNKENRYSSVIRNSRPRPQNDGIDKLSEVEGGGVARERPQYTTITRTQAPKSQNSNDETENERPFSPTPATAGKGSDEEDDNSPTTHQPTYNYVNIQRARPSSTAAPVEEEAANEKGNESDYEDTDDEEEEEKPASVQPTSTSKMQYVNIQRIRPTKPQYISDEVESETPATDTKWVNFFGVVEVESCDLILQNVYFCLNFKFNRNDTISGTRPWAENDQQPHKLALSNRMTTQMEINVTQQQR